MACFSSNLCTGMDSFPRKRFIMGRLLANLSFTSISSTSVGRDTKLKRYNKEKKRVKSEELLWYICGGVSWLCSVVLQYIIREPTKANWLTVKTTQTSPRWTWGQTQSHHTFVKTGTGKFPVQLWCSRCQHANLILIKCVPLVRSCMLAHESDQMHVHHTWELFLNMQKF